MSAEHIPPDDGAARPPRPRLEVVGVGARPDVGHLQDTPALSASFTPLADFDVGGAIGFEVELGARGDLPVAPREWSRRGAPGRAAEVEALVLRKALGQRRALPAGTALVISLSGQGFVSAPVQQELGATGSLDDVWLAVSCEPDADLRALRTGITAARALGATIVLDEADMGYPALRRLIRLRPDAIRIAPDFVEELDRDAARSAVVETLVAVARRIDARVIAEGVSSASELAALVQLGVHAGSGPLFGEDLPDAGPLPQGAVAAIEEFAGAVRRGRESVATLMEPLPTLPLDASLQQLADTFLEDARSDFVVLVDDDARPSRIVERAAMLRAEPYEHMALTVTDQTEVRTVARRAAARSSYERFVPVVCTDARGRVSGVVRVDRLLEALAGAE